MTGTKFTGLKAQFLNLREDGIKFRSSKIESKKRYKRTVKHKNSNLGN